MNKEYHTYVRQLIQLANTRCDPKCLTEREKDILNKRFCDEWDMKTYDELAKDHSLSAPRVYSIQQAAVKKLANALKSTYFN